MSKVELTPAKLADIKKKAEAAETQGPSPWEFVKTVEENHIYFEVRDNDDCQLVTQEEAEHIAEANPATVLAMVQEIERLRKDLNLDHLREKLAEPTTIYNAIPPACPDAQALVQARIDSVKKEIQKISGTESEAGQ